MRILAIETSCDETSIAIVETSGSIQKPNFKVLSHITSSQVKIHEKFGGVVPNLAAREHQKNLVPILIKALREAMLYKEAGIKKQELRKKYLKKSLNSKFIILNSILKREQELFARIREHIAPLTIPEIDTITVTIGPGLEPALWVGINFAKALSILWDKPIIPVDHMEGHIFSALLKEKQRNPKHEARNPKQIINPKFKNKKTFRISNFEFPAVALLVSGGHTELVLIKKIGKYKIVGETLDDAAGEAFDKVARLLGLGYPGGPAISALAEKEIRSTKSEIAYSAEVASATKAGRNKSKIQNSKLQIQLPRPMLHSDNLNFSFSGLKTAVLYLIQDLENPSTIRQAHGGEQSRTTGSGQAKYDIKKLRSAIAKEFQDAVVEVLVKKTIGATKKYDARTILLGGGVAANKLLRQELTRNAKMSRVELLTSPLELTGDNALMIAVAAFFQKKKAGKNISLLRAIGNLRIS